MRFILPIVILLSMVSCSKEGVGGSSLISGTVSKKLITSKGHVVDTIPAIDKEVFITYGEGTFYNDDVKTNVSGTFEFPFLEKGGYSLFAYGDCLDCDNGKVAVSKSVSMTKGENVSVDLIVEKIVDYDDGSSVLSGVLMEQEYVGSFPVNTPYPSQENEVYITYGDDAVYFDRMDTGFDGKYEFKDLIKGEYTIYAYSKCGTCVSVNDTVSYSIQITENNSVYTGDSLTLEERK